MAREVYRFSVLIPKGTAQATPQVTALTMPERVVVKVAVVVPPGPRGLLGFQFTHAGSQLIPINTGQFVVADGEKIEWDLSDYLTTGAWQLTAYNTGSFDHTLEIRFEADLLPRPAQLAGFQPIPNDALQSA